MTDEETIQRPKGRRNNSIDLGPSRTEQPEKPKREPISFGRKKTEEQPRQQSDPFGSDPVYEPVQQAELSPRKPLMTFGKKRSETAEQNGYLDQPSQSSQQTETTQRKPIVTFGRKKTEEPVQQQPRQDPFEVTRPSNPVQQEPERRSYSASIDMGASTGQRKASIDLGTNRPQAQSQQRQGSMDLGQRQPQQQSQPGHASVDLGSAERRQTSNTMDLGATRAKSGNAGIDVGPSTIQSQSQIGKKKPSLGGLGGIIPLGKKTETEDRKGTWGNTGYSASNEQAHRDVTYHIPPFMKQTMIVFMVQMKLFAKMKWTYFMLFVALLIPIAVVAGGDFLQNFMMMNGFASDYSNTYIGGLLSFLPLLIGLFTSVLCGTQLPNEFKERTAYMNVSLPMSRASFYLGKYLAGFIMCLGVFMFAYGMAIATSTMKYDSIFADLLGQSLSLTIVAVFAYSATAYCIGSFMRRGSSMVPFIVMAIALPAVCALGFMYFISEGTDLSWVFNLPCFLGEAALGVLGSQMSGSVGMLILPYMDLSSVSTNIVVGIVWGIAFFVLGMIKTVRREM